MEIVIKGILGALVAILLHLSTNTRHFYLSGLIPLFPTFALFAHTMFASNDRVADMQVSAQFGMLALFPYGIYLVLVWWLPIRLSVWPALTIALAGWLVAAATIVLIWGDNSSWIAKVRNGPLLLTIGIAACVFTCFASGRDRINKLFRVRRESVRRAPHSIVDSSRVWFVVLGLVICIALLAGFLYTYRSPGINDWASIASLKPVEDTGIEDPIAMLFKCADSNVVNAWTRKKTDLNQSTISGMFQQGQHCVFSHYVALAKSADAAGKSQLAATYLEWARSVLFGLGVDGVNLWEEVKEN